MRGKKKENKFQKHVIEYRFKVMPGNACRVLTWLASCEPWAKSLQLHLYLGMTTSLSYKVVTKNKMNPAAPKSNS